ncbi:MAG: AI-2E family transporter [Rhodobacteraceae bacterium]|nr:AI-2E family transporter [Paracoccaceae bacterium]
MIGIFLLLLVAGFAYARAFLMPSLLALLLALVFSPPRRALERLGVGSGIAALVITGALLAGTVAAVLALATPVSEWTEDAQIIGRQIEWKLRDLRGLAAQVQDAAKQVEEIADAAAGEDVQRVVVEGPGVATSLVGSAPAIVGQALFTLVLLFFLLASGDMIYEKIVQVMPTFSDKRRAVMIARDIERKLSHYLFTITAINAGLGVAVGIAMWLLGMPNPALFGTVAFLLNYIPYIGALAGVLLTAAVGLVSLPTASDAFLAAGAFLALTSIEGQFITPVFVGRNLQLNTVAVFLSVTFWAWVWSVVGMLVATPLLVAVKVFCEHIPALEPVGLFLSARGAELEGTEETAAEKETDA